MEEKKNEKSEASNKYGGLFLFGTIVAVKTVFKRKKLIEFIDTVKFRTALSALESQNRKLSLTTLSYILGYTDQSHFIKAFKKRSGVSPLQFKKSSKNENGFTWTE